MNAERIIYLDGKFVGQSDAKISVFDQGVLFGDGVFEGIRAYNGRVFKLDEHIERLYQGAKVLLLDIPLTPEEMKAVVIETCARNGISDGYIRLVVTRGTSPHLGLFPVPGPFRPFSASLPSLSLYPGEVYEHGMPIITAVQRRSRATGLDPQIKSLNYLNNILAKAESFQGRSAGSPDADRGGIRRRMHGRQYLYCQGRSGSNASCPCRHPQWDHPPGSDPSG